MNAHENSGAERLRVRRPHRGPWSSDRRAKAGQALAEFVLVVPILLLLVFGVVEFGLAFRTHQIVTNTAREGARIAVLPSTTNNQMVEDVVEGRLANSGLDPDVAVIELSCDGTAGSLCFGSDRFGRLSEVAVEYPYRFFILGGLVRWACGDGCAGSFGTVQLRAASSMRNE
jgi:hypothetical protein